MKKLFSSILVLGLLFSGNAYAEILLTNCSYNPHKKSLYGGLLYNEWEINLEKMTVNKNYYYDNEGEKRYGTKKAIRKNIKLIKIDDETYRTEFMQSAVQKKYSYADTININSGVIKSYAYTTKDKIFIIKMLQNPK
jgi:hypothetical protein